MKYRYTVAIIQYARINSEDIPEVNNGKDANLEKISRTFKSLGTWQEVSPVSLVVSQRTS
jgi:hypothetical protein